MQLPLARADWCQQGTLLNLSGPLKKMADLVHLDIMHGHNCNYGMLSKLILFDQSGPQLQSRLSF